MKKIFSTFVFLCAWSGIALAQDATPQGQESYGGNGTVGEFRLISLDLQRLVGYLPASTLPSATFAADFIAKGPFVEIQGQDKVYLDGVEVDAKNFPYKQVPLIEVSVSRWSALTTFAKYHLVLHEMLPILGFIDDHYQYSIPIMGALSKNGLKEFSVMEIAQGSFQKCEKGDVGRSTFLLMNFRLKRDNAEEMKALYKLALDTQCGLAVRYLMDVAFPLQDLKYEGVYYVWLVIQEVLRATPAAFEKNMAFFQAVRDSGFPMHVTSDMPEIASEPVSLIHQLAQIQNPALFKRTVQVFQILIDSSEPPQVTRADLQKARMNKNHELAALMQKFLR
ncbi:MAG: hypothetical protein OM95_12950 [Bdellovibrio sp. ArHS]|uniref:hypothetical protein n=1 Tax=Bdellovibrio sp. ArHS TaxID=1569284 RepID=UPI000582A83C|nr:hypothetical protein [Bdellovibrio sp. ArHS]KHD87723.1 MAG: hypothetical protein OM95_12950 [Bdellovibrio sp. ArHS]